MTVQGKAVDRRNFLKGVVLTAALPLTVSACSSPSKSTGSGEVKFVLWDYQPDTSKGLVAGFQKQAQGVTVTTQIEPYAQYPTSVQFMQTGKQPFDVLYMQDERLAQWSSWMEPIEGYDGASALIAKLSPAAKQALTHNGKVYGLPYFLGFVAFTYNDLMLAKAGIPKPASTWDELLTHAKQLKSQGISQYPLVFPGGLGSSQISYIFYSMLASRAGSLLDDKGKLTKEAKASMQWLVDAQKAGVLHPSILQLDYQTAPKAFMTGEHAFMLALSNASGPAFANDPKASKVAGHAKLALMPGNGATISWTRGIGMNSASTNKEQAWELIKYLGGTDKNGEYVAAETWMEKAGLPYGYNDEKLANSSQVTSTLKVWTDPSLWNDQLQKGIHLSAVTPFSKSGFPQLDDKIQRTLQDVISGNTSIDAAATTLEDTAKSLGA
ncbi:extracellular solute-binding protein [Arthrobacter sp. StoSoilB5]|uniref:extracellular solute-binding protein n=1 Tax=Arthrobacter sp. StoSoilB5 TaxID=2830992 RepID=UPI001CC441F0|nr:extracellular solute-binding protein [Arthrobacter sp. StoSoilB5]